MSLGTLQMGLYIHNDIRMSTHHACNQPSIPILIDERTDGIGKKEYH